MSHDQNIQDRAPLPDRRVELYLRAHRLPPPEIHAWDESRVLHYTLDYPDMLAEAVDTVLVP